MMFKIKLILFLFILTIDINSYSERISFNRFGISFIINENWSIIPNNYLKNKNNASYSNLTFDFINNDQLIKLLINYKYSIEISGIMINLNNKIKLKTIIQNLESFEYNQKIYDDIIITLERINIKHNSIKVHDFKFNIIDKNNKNSGYIYVFIIELDNNKCLQLVVKNFINNNKSENEIVNIVKSIKIEKIKNVYHRLVGDNFYIDNISNNFIYGYDYKTNCYYYENKNCCLIRIFSEIDIIDESKIKNLYEKTIYNSDFMNYSKREIIYKKEDDIFLIIDFLYKDKYDLNIINDFIKKIIIKRYALIIHEPTRMKIIIYEKEIDNQFDYTEYYKGNYYGKNILVQYIHKNNVLLKTISFIYLENDVVEIKDIIFYDKDENYVFSFRFKKYYTNFLTCKLEINICYIFNTHNYNNYNYDYITLNLEYNNIDDLKRLVYNDQILISDFIKNKYDFNIYEKLNYSYNITLVSKSETTLLFKKKNKYNEEKDFNEKSFEIIETDIAGEIKNIKKIFINNKEERIIKNLFKINESEYYKIRNDILKQYNIIK